MQWRTLFQKEMLEHWRNKKWIWVPLVMMLVAMMDPVSIYFLPEIIDQVGDVPDGMVLEMPALEPVEAFMMSIEALSTYGVVIITLMMMGTIAGERKAGVTEIILAKPVKFRHYLSSKWLGFISISLTSLVLSLGLSAYYVALLYGSIRLYPLLLTISLYSLWFMFVVTLCIFYHTICRSAGVVVACTIGTLAVMAGVNAAIGHKATWFPNNLSTHLNELLLTETIPDALYGTIGIILLLILILSVAAVKIFQRQEMV